MRRVAVLDGGFPAWEAQGLPVDDSSISKEAVEAAAAACAKPPSTSKYAAHLQVGGLILPSKH